jgi:predicted metalloprotease with PDZ domain
MKFGIEYLIKPNDPIHHTIEVDLIIWQPQAIQTIQMPTWIPGSYMIRDFSKHITNIHAYEINDKAHLISPVILEAKDSNTWAVHTTKKPVLIRMKVYAFDTSVRTAFLDLERCFYNHTSLCMQVVGQANEPCLIHVEQSVQLTNLELMTSLRPVAINKSGFGSYEAQNYDELVDHPVSIGKFQKVSWKSFGIPHEMVFTGATEKLDAKRLASDLKAITEAHIELFEPQTQKAPFKHYLFHVNVTANGYGGLEHRSSTALVCKRFDLPYVNRTVQKKSYEDFLGLCSHEYFHAWHVKNIQPENFQPYRLQERNHTSLLWLFEGFTSYYDDLQLIRSGVISLETYLDRLSRTINAVQSNAGRLKQSVAQSSFDAWTKYYLMDENTPNAVVSYYAKGSLIALGLDLTIRQFTNQTQSLDDVMRTLWKMHGSLNTQGIGIAESGFKEVILNTLGEHFLSTWNAFEKRYILGTEDLPFTDLLKTEKYALVKKEFSKPEFALKRFGIRFNIVDQTLRVTHVLEGGSAQRGGVAAGDFILSINRERVTPSNFQTLLEYFSNQEMVLHIFRQELLYVLMIPKDEGAVSQWKIEAIS